MEQKELLDEELQARGELTNSFSLSYQVLY